MDGPAEPGPAADTPPPHGGPGRKRKLVDEDTPSKPSPAEVAGPAADGLPSTVRAVSSPPPYWLPSGWKHGVKTTCRTRLPAFVSPEGKIYYHRKAIEQVVGRQLGGNGTIEGSVAWATQQLAAGKDWHGRDAVTEGDDRMLARLTGEERAALPEPSELHFAVVSARRASAPGGIKDIVKVQAALVAAGARPRWYVDEASLQDYRSLGLDAVVGGKLTPARNRALQDAADQGRACVQVSDDISRWIYAFGEKVAKGESKTALQVANAAVASTKQLSVSPVSAARFILAKMRHTGAKLGGVFPLANLAMSLFQDEFTDQHFILGDFFVAEASPVRFDTSITLKEDYDFTCSHLRKHGRVVRCNRLMLTVRHCSNAGGAVANRDSNGEAEQRNIAILRAKWPGVFRDNKIRPNEVIMSWSSHRPLQPAGDAGDAAAAAPEEGQPAAAPPAKTTSRRAPRGLARSDFPVDAVVVGTARGNLPKGYIAERLKAVEGRTVQQCLTEVYYDRNGEKKRYNISDLNYDIKLGRLKVVAPLCVED